MEKVIDWAVYLEHIQVILKKFNTIATFYEDILLGQFQTFYLYLVDKQNIDLGNGQKIFKKAIDIKAKINQQLFFLYKKVMYINFVASN